VVICGNKQDIAQVPKARRGYNFRDVLTWAPGAQLYELSAKSNYNFEKPFLYLMRAKWGQEMVFKPFPEDEEIEEIAL
jgi:hypothetical protein